MVWVTGDGLEKACAAVPANLSTVYRRDRRAATDVFCGTIHLYDQCLVESTAQTKLVRHAEHEIQQQLLQPSPVRLTRHVSAYLANKDVDCRLFVTTRPVTAVSTVRYILVLFFNILLIVPIYFVLCRGTKTVAVCIPES